MIAEMQTVSLGNGMAGRGCHTTEACNFYVIDGELLGEPEI
jgi:hypothetical protein